MVKTVEKDEFELLLNETTGLLGAPDSSERLASLIRQWGSWLRREREVDFTLLWTSYNIRKHEEG